MAALIRTEAFCGAKGGSAACESEVVSKTASSFLSDKDKVF